MRKRRIAFIWANVGPYHDARMAALVRHGIADVTCIELTSRPALRQWGRPGDRYYHLISLSRQRDGEVKPYGMSARLSRALERCRPQAVFIAGYSLSPMRDAFRWAARQGIPGVLLSDSTAQDRPRWFILEQMKRWWIKRYVSAAIVSGIRARDYIVSLGIPTGRISTMMDVVDNQFYSRVADRVRHRRQWWLREIGNSRPFILFAGRLAHEKNIAILLTAYAHYRRQFATKSWDLVIAGSGPQELELKSASGGQAGVKWAGFQTGKQLATLYGLAECLVLPSTSEPWGLVVNEAMAAGIPVIASKSCGCVPELVHDGRTGYRIDPLRPDSIARAIGRLHESPRIRAAMGRASRILIDRHGLPEWCGSVRRVISMVTS